MNSQVSRAAWFSEHVLSDATKEEPDAPLSYLNYFLVAPFEDKELRRIVAGAKPSPRSELPS